MNTAVDTQDTGDKDQPLNMAEMSDEEIMNLDPDTLPDDAGDALETKPEDDPEDQVTDPEDPKEEGENFPDLQDVYYASDDATSDADAPGPDPATDGGEKDTSPADDAGDQPGETDYKAAYTDLMSPFKAAKREVRLNNPEDARRLMQMGVDYSRKMEAMKPHQKVLKTLEKNGLLDPEKINFLIDLDKKKPEAMKKFFKDSELDLHELDYEDDDKPDYKPTDYSVGDTEMALEEALDSISDTEQYERTVDIISNKMDAVSRQALVDNPNIIKLINDHIGVGIYDKINDIVKQERVFGRLTGISDLEAYKTVGDAIDAKGGFGTNPDNPKDPKQRTSSDGRAQDFGQDSRKKADTLRRNRKRAASPTKGAVSKTKEVAHNYLSEYTDKEIEEMGPSIL